MPRPHGPPERRRALLLILALPLAACAPLPPATDVSRLALPAVQPAFSMAGRLSARHGSEAFAAGFRWRHAQEGDEIEFVSPLGQTVAMLQGDGRGVSLRAADGRVFTADNWETLTEQGLGWRLPVDGLAFWVQGAPRSGAPFNIEPGANGRAEVLHQEGWTIVYLAYAADEAAVERPSRMTLSYPEIELRIAVDAWR
jgi:outer membrane lipoprotein LolB